MLGAGAIASAQIPSVTDTTSTPVPNAGHEYIESPNETVNPANGSLSLRLGVPLSPSRGVNIPFGFAYDSGPLYMATPYGSYGIGWHPVLSRLSQGGWSYTVPMLSVQDHQYQFQYSSGPDENPVTQTCDAYADFVFQGPSGNRFNLGLYDWDINNAQCNENILPDQPSMPYSFLCEGGPGTCPITDNSFVNTQVTYPVLATLSYPAFFNSGSVNPVNVVDADGTDYFFGSQQNPGAGWSCTAPTGCLGTLAATTITDRNGNVAHLSGTATGTPISPGDFTVLNYTDSIGRTALNIPTFGASQDLVTVGGLSAPYQVQWTTITPRFTVNLDFLAGSPDNSHCAPSGPFGNNQPSLSVVSSITLPNGQTYQFDYSNNTFGQVDRITYPNGGYVRYVWGTNPQSQFGAFLKSYSISEPGESGTGVCDYYYDTPAILQRFVSYDGSSEVEEQDFSYATTWAPPPPYVLVSQYWASKTTTVLTKDLVQNTQFQTVYTYQSTVADSQPTDGQVSQIPVESAIQYYQSVPIGTNPAGAALLQTVNKTWQNTRLLTKQVATLNTGQVSETDWTYNANEMETEKDDYDFGAGARGTLLRKTLYPSYHTFTSQSGATAHIVDKPDSVQVQDASGNVVAGAGYTYDTSINSVTGNPTANLLARSNWLNSTGTSAVTTTHTYDAYGNIHTTTDPNGNTTTYNYSPDSFVDTCSIGSSTNAYLTSIVYPQTNNVAHTESFQYHCATGELASSTDENGQVTTYTYADPLNRLTQTNYPDGGQKTISYNDSGSNPTVTTSTLMNNSGQSMVSIIKMDGLGHAIQSQLASDPVGPDYTDTVYDGLGHAYTVSNPYRSTSEPTYGLTTYTYDALGRPLTVTKPDRNTTSTSYTGAATDSWDENGTHMQHTSDALGRLTKVMELGTAADPRSLETDYTYDTLGDLTYVSQQGASGETPRTRSFTYDSLGRLITSSNPETGTICYGIWSGSTCGNGYDANGNLLNKSLANGIAIQYQYDQLNRLLNKTGSDLYGTTDNFFYDVCDYPSCTNPIGRLTLELERGTQAGTDYSYDAMGRVKTTGWLDYFSGGHLITGISATYDLAGNPTQLSYADGRTIQQSYDNAGHLVSIADTTSGGPGTVYFSNGTYTAAGGLIFAAYGNGVTENIAYNNRLQPCFMAANTPARLPVLTPLGGWQQHNPYAYQGNLLDRVSTYASSPSGISYCGQEPGNNGNMGTILDYVAPGWTQSFTYDGLNRLSSAARSDGGYNHTYNYDGFGNLIVQDNLNTNPTFSIDAATNRLNRWNGPVNVYTYDPSGNLTSTGTSDIGGHSFVYNFDSQIQFADRSNFYAYDALGQRIAKDGGYSGATEYAYFNGQPMSEIDQNWTVTDYIYANGQKIAKVTNANAVNYYLDDHLGTTQVELDSSGNVTWQGQFTPFGQELPDGTTSMHYKFTGKERDAETGLDFFGARYYGSTIGRWLSPDWAAKPEAVPYSKLDSPQSLNLYNYVGNNPLSRADPDGHACPIMCIVDVIREVHDGIKRDGSIGAYAKNAGIGALKGAGTLIQQVNPVGMFLKTPAFLKPSNESQQHAASATQIGLAAASGPVLGTAAGVEGAAGAGLSDSALVSRANELHDALDPIAQQMRTTAVANVTDAEGATSIMVGQSGRMPGPSVRALLNPGETAVGGTGHAEVNIVNAAASQGLQVNGVAASRGICPSCAEAIESAGGTPVNPK